jgi:hypothetical protein
MVPLLKIAFALALLGYVVWYLEPASLLAGADLLERGQLLLCGVLGVLGIGVQWVKWQRLLRFQLPGAKWSEGLVSLLGGAALGLVTPGRIGELGRGLVLGKKRASLALMTGVDKLSSSGITVVLGWLAAWVMVPSWRLWLVAFGVVVTVGIGVAWRWVPTHWRSAIKCIKPKSSWCYVMGFSLLFNLIFFAQFYTLVAAESGFDMSVALAIPMVFALKALLPIGFLDIGVREAAAVLVFSHFGFAAELAFNASILLFAFNVCLPAVLGWLWLGVRRYWGNERIEMMRKVAL